MVAETEYLLRIAGHRLNLARDTRAALAAMELADQRLRDTLDPGWAGVREQIGGAPTMFGDISQCFAQRTQFGRGPDGLFLADNP